MKKQPVSMMILAATLMGCSNSTPPNFTPVLQNTTGCQATRPAGNTGALGQTMPVAVDFTCTPLLVPSNGEKQMLIHSSMAGQRKIRMNTQNSGTYSQSPQTRWNYTLASGLKWWPGEEISVTVPMQSGVNSASVVTYKVAPASSTFTGFDPWKVISSFPTRVDTGDVNGDGRLDVLTGGTEAGEAEIQLQGPDGNFTTRTLPPSGRTAVVKLADVTGDGRLDVLTGSLYEYGITLMVQDTQGNFSARKIEGLDVTTLDTGDLNGDGKLDVVSASENANRVDIHQQNPDGTFTRQSMYSDRTSSVKIADMNRDGKMDIVAGHNWGTFGISLYVQGPSGTFTRQNVQSQTSNSIDVGDINGDGRLDFITGANNDFAVEVNLQNPTGGFTSSRLSAFKMSSVKLVDLNGDGRLDIVGGMTQVAGLVVYLQTSSGTFNSVGDGLLARRVRGVAAGDFNRDGKMDLALASEGLRLYLNR